MRRFVTSSRARRRILVLGAVLAAAPALAQAQPATGTPEKGAAGTPRAGRAISATGRTMPPPRGAGQPAVAGEAAMATGAEVAPNEKGAARRQPPVSSDPVGSQRE